MIDDKGVGLEIGPSFNPLLPKAQGFNVETVDHADAASLREKYSGHANIDISPIEEVDYVSDGRSLFDLIGKPGHYDYIVASHVIEHVTDVVRFIQDCDRLLKPDGRLLLVIPDKRFCFDALRPVSTTGEVLQAFYEARTRHTPGHVFDYVNSHVKKQSTKIWVDTTLDDLAFTNSPEAALAKAEDVRNSDQYFDAHAWRFTPSSFRYLVKNLRQLGFVESGVSSITANDDSPVFRFEFYVALSKSALEEEMSDIDLAKASQAELYEIAPIPAPVSDTTELERLRKQVEAMHASASWRITAPLRFLRSLVR